MGRCVLLVAAVSLVCISCSRNDNEPLAAEPAVTTARQAATEMPAPKPAPAAISMSAELPEICGTVVHAQTFLPIPGATAQLHYRTNDADVLLETSTGDDGVFSFGRTDCRKPFDLVAYADGYVRWQKRNPAPPVEIALLPGKGIRVTGTVRDERGRPLPNGLVSLGNNTGTQDPDEWDDKAWSPVGLFRARTKEDGAFAIGSVTAEGVLVPMVQHADYPDTTFNDAQIDPARGDAHVDLAMQPGLAVSGRVVFSKGGPVSNALVWAERVPPAGPDEWSAGLTTLRRGLARTTARTDDRGEFHARFVPDDERFIVKAWARGYQPAYAGPFDKANPAPSLVEITISDAGGRIAGMFAMTDGMPVTNVSAEQMVMRRVGVSEYRGEREFLTLDVSEDGSYSSGLIKEGEYTIGFRHAGSPAVGREVAVRNGETELVNVTFSVPPVITGVVCDFETRKPVAGVRIRGERSALLTDETDGQGRFVLRLISSYASLVFSHPDYAETKWESQTLERTSSPAVLLSKGGTVIVRVFNADGTLGSNLVAVIKEDTGNGKRELLKEQIADGTATFTNVPSCLARCVAEVFGKGFDSLHVAGSEEFTPRADAETTVNIALPDFATFLVRFGEPVNRMDIDINAGPYSSPRGGRPFCADSMTFEGNVAKNDFVTPGAYRVRVNGPNVETIFTNLSFSAGGTTVLDVITGTNMLGVITGRVYDAHRMGIESMVSVNLQTLDPAQHETDERVMHAWARNGSFALGGLRLDQLYRVKVKGPTNATIENVRPNGPPIHIVVGLGYRITGRIVDDRRKPVSAWVDDCQTDADGEFKVERVVPGEVQLQVRPESFVPFTYPVIVVDRDVDVGDIVVQDPGVKVTGRTVGANGKPVPGVELRLTEIPDENQPRIPVCSKFAVSGNDGMFLFAGVPRGSHAWLYVSVRGASSYGPFDGDTDLGDIVASRVVLVVTVRGPNGEVPAGYYIRNMPLDANGMCSWEVSAGVNPFGIARVPPGQPATTNDTYSYRANVTPSPTNYLTVTLPEWFWRQ